VSRSSPDGGVGYEAVFTTHAVSHLCTVLCVCARVRACACRIRNRMCRGVSVYIEECLCSRQHHLLHLLIIVACDVKFMSSFESGNLARWSLFTEYLGLVVVECWRGCFGLTRCSPQGSV
jgi:hypothetical protein